MRLGSWLVVSCVLGLSSAGCDDRSPDNGTTATARAPETPPPPDPGLAKMRTAYDLVTNRVHGLEYDAGRLVIRTGRPEFLKFIDGGWKTSWILGLKDEGRDVALVSGLAGTMFFPVDDQNGGVQAPA
ncbi:MAG TPA: hypothetical protein VGG33_21430, partial [Polyangia bacterium]